MRKYSKENSLCSRWWYIRVIGEIIRCLFSHQLPLIYTSSLLTLRIIGFVSDSRPWGELAAYRLSEWGYNKHGRSQQTTSSHKLSQWGYNKHGHSQQTASSCRFSQWGYKKWPLSSDDTFTKITTMRLQQIWLLSAGDTFTQIITMRLHVKDSILMVAMITDAVIHHRPNQWETALLCNDISHWLGANLESVLTSPSVLWFVITYPYLYFSGSLAKLQIKLWHYIPQIYVDVITYPLSKPSARLTNSCLQTRLYISGLVQDCSNSSALAMELLQSCPKPSIFGVMGFFLTSEICQFLTKNQGNYFEV